MDLNGVSFNEELCLKMSKKEFVKSHVDSLYLDRSKEDREKLLDFAYDKMKGKKVDGAEQ